MQQKVRVRFAPSPTGNLHVGGARTALFNWLFARHLKGTFVLRVEDTDAERSKEEYTKAIIDGLSWLGLDWDEGPEAGGNFGPYFQSQRMENYKRSIETLLNQGKIYHCFCSPDTLAKMREIQSENKLPQKYDGRCRNLAPEDARKRIDAGEKFVLRLKAPSNEAIPEGITWNDITKGPLSISSDQIDDLVIVKSDGFPTYNFAVVIDDVEMQISHVIRGEDHISNTPKQILIYKALEAKIPAFAHIPMILGPDRSRLSKRHGATSVIEYKDLGFEPEAFRNYLSLLGWSPESGKEILSKEELISEFDLSRVSSHGAIFNMEKLRWMNQEYIKAMSPEKLFAKLKPWYEKNPHFPGDYSNEMLLKMGTLFRERLKSFDEILPQIEWFFSEPSAYDSKGMEKAEKIAGFREIGLKLVEKVEKIQDFSEQNLESLIRAHAEETGKKAGDVIHICRLALSGKTTTPGLFETMVVLGKARCLNRLRKFLAVRS